MTSLVTRRRIRRLTVLASSLLFCFFSGAATTQVANRTSLPRVGTIKDYPATGLMVGCGNLYFYKAEHKDSMTDNYVFLSRGDGGNAWMNLNGRDVRLRKIKSPYDRNFHRYSYRYRDVRITVEFAEYTPPPGEAEHTSKMKITFRRGRSVRVVRAVGGSDC